MSAFVSMLLALAAPEGAGEVREFQALGTIRDDGGSRSARVYTDRDRDADGMADEGEVRVSCRSGKVVAADFVAGPTTTMIPVGRRVARDGDDARPTIHARYDPGTASDAGGRLVAISATSDWCALR